VADRTVLLVRSPGFGWDGLRRSLQNLPELEIVGDTRVAAEALALATQLHPSLILTGSRVDGQPVLPLLRIIRERSPDSRLVVIVGRETELEPAALLALRGLAVEAQLLWSDLAPESLRRCVQEPPLRPPELTADERAVLRGVAQGLTHAEIAETASVSERTVERVINRLEEKFGVSAPTTLVAKAALLGLVPWDWVAQSPQNGNMPPPN